MQLTHADEHDALREAARQALATRDWRRAARDALDGEPLPDGWPLAVQAGWAGVLVPGKLGGAGLDVFEAMLVMVELGRELASVGLLGHLPATLIVAAAHGRADADGLLGDLATGHRRAACLLAAPSGVAGTRLHDGAPAGFPRTPAPTIKPSGGLAGSADWVVDATDADVLVVACRDAHGRPAAAVVSSAIATVQPAHGYDGSRALAHLTFDDAAAHPLDVPGDAGARAWFLAQALLGAEAIGSVERLLDLSVAHAKSRVAFGRPIGSFQAIKHPLVEILRRLDNARALMHRVGRVGLGDGTDFAIAASALRFVAGDALDFAARTAIAVHGGIGVTWEHDLPLYFRRAQLNRRLLGGHAAAADHVGATLLATASDRGRDASRV